MCDIGTNYIKTIKATTLFVVFLFVHSWEQRKFNELYEKVSEKNDLTYGTDEIISVANMYFKSDSFITDKEYLRTYNVFHLGDIAFEGNKSKNFAHGRFVENTIGDGIVSHVFDVFRPKIKYDLLFWKYAINNERLMGGILVRSTKASTMMTNLVANDFLQETILVPSLEEQKKIGSILENVDNLITLHQRKDFSRFSQILRRKKHSFLPISWEQRKFNELYEKVSEKNDLTYGTDEIISVANMYFKSDSFITDKEYLRTYNVFHLGDIAFEGNKSKNFAHGRFVENTIGDGIVSHVFDVFRPKIKYDLLFWKYAINNERLMGGILVRSTKASTMMTNLVANDFLQETILVPSLEEQKKIGSILENVDNLITLHQRKDFSRFSQILRRKKHSFLPISWEQRKFGETVQIERGGSPRPIDDFITTAPDGLNWVKIGDAPEQGNYITKTAEKIKPSGLSKTREVHPNDLILSNSMSFGKPYIMAINGCIHDGWLLIRDNQERFDLKFLCHLLGTSQMLSQYKSMAAGSTVNNLNKELVGNTIVTFPMKQEQQKIGKCFELFDNLITLHQRQLEKLKNIKSALLEKMFV